MAHGRFVILSDEHIPYALVQSLVKAQWLVHRVEDERELGKGTEDHRIFTYAAERGWVWLSRDEAAVVHPATWHRSGRPFKGMLVWSQRHHRVMSLGDVVRQLSQDRSGPRHSLDLLGAHVQAKSPRSWSMATS